VSSLKKEPKKADPFDFDAFGQDLPQKSKIENFDNSNYQQQPVKAKEDEVFSGGFQSQPPASTNQTSNNPFDAFNVLVQPQPQAPIQQPNNTRGDVFTQYNAFGAPTQQNTGFNPPTQPNTGIGSGQADWNAGFSNQFSSDPFTSGGAFDPPKPLPKNQDFASLDPFSGK